MEETLGGTSTTMYFLLPSLPVAHSFVPSCTRHLFIDSQLCVNTRNCSRTGKVQDDALLIPGALTEQIRVEKVLTHALEVLKALEQ